LSVKDVEQGVDLACDEYAGWHDLDTVEVAAGQSADDGELARDGVPRAQPLLTVPRGEEQRTARRVPGDAIGWPGFRTLHGDLRSPIRDPVDASIAGVRGVQHTIAVEGEVVDEARLERGHVDEGEVRAGSAIEPVDAVRVRNEQRVAADDHPARRMQRRRRRAHHELKLFDRAVGPHTRDVAIRVADAVLARA